jgi:type VI protein secretion system component Hcp
MAIITTGTTPGVSPSSHPSAPGTGVIGIAAIAAEMGIDTSYSLPLLRGLITRQVRGSDCLRLEVESESGPNRQTSTSVIEVLNFSWGRASVGTESLVVVAKPSALSTTLFAAMVNGHPVRRLRLVGTRLGPGGQNTEYLQVDVRDGMVCEFLEQTDQSNIALESWRDAVLETITFSYAELRYRYYPQHSDGSYGTPSVGRCTAGSGA